MSQVTAPVILGCAWQASTNACDMSQSCHASRVTLLIRNGLTKFPCNNMFSNQNRQPYGTTTIKISTKQYSIWPDSYQLHTQSKFSKISSPSQEYPEDWIWHSDSINSFWNHFLHFQHPQQTLPLFLAHYGIRKYLIRDWVLPTKAKRFPAKINYLLQVLARDT